MTILTPPNSSEPVLTGSVFAVSWWRWVSRVTAILSGREPVQLPAYTIARLPEASGWKDCAVIVTDEVGGRVLATSDGSIWKRAYDNTEVM